MPSGDGPDAPSAGFERYASEALLAAGARRIRPIAARHDRRLGLIWLTGLSWIQVYDELDDQEMATVLAHLEDNLKSLTNSVSRVRQTLDENSGPRNQTNNVPW